MAFEISPVLNYFYQGIENSVQTLKIQYSLDTPILEQMYQPIHVLNDCLKRKVA